MLSSSCVPQSKPLVVPVGSRKVVPGRRQHFERNWYVRRRLVLDALKRSNVGFGNSCSFVNGDQSAGARRCGIVNPCKVAFSERTEDLLRGGPKFCVNVKPSRVDVFSAIQTIARKVGLDERVAFVDYAVSRMERVVDDSYKKDRRNFQAITEVRKDFKSRSLELLQTDKSGMFAVLPLAVFEKKSTEALDSAFMAWQGKLGKLRKDISATLKDEGLETLARKVLNQPRSTLSLKFFLKDHKPEMPFRTVINENGTWQSMVSKFLQKGLDFARLENSLSSRNSDDFVQILDAHHGRQCSLISMDIKDLYYSLEKQLLMSRVREALERNLVKFQSGTGIPADSFLAILDLYLKATVVEFKERMWIQKKGVCIGSAVAPILAEIYLNSLDNAISERLAVWGSGEVLVRRYVDDIVVMSFHGKDTGAIESPVRASAPELTFTVEGPDRGVLQFLDLRIHVQEGVCWEYGKESAKPVLSRRSCHSKTVKAGVVKSIIGNALKKSCLHYVGQALKRQWVRLEDAGYDKVFITRQLSPSFGSRNGTTRERSKKVAVVPYYHSVSHNLKASAHRFGVDVVFSSDYKLNRMTPFFAPPKACRRQHQDTSVACKGGVVYEIPLACGFRYVGQTSRCVNDRLTEHKRNVKNGAPNSEIAKHVSECNNCKVFWSETEVIHREENEIKRVLKETVRIKSMGNCISQPSMHLGESSRKFLKM
ncbi:uncharacterized protein LOC115331401 [Ixodes scapularis]|uniref:uncharacterized protein LOC115331401 n=1 Tax=Ixodes scapularis TaxID=6945 RepID=UPI001A9DA2A8|nr:uncharacterized protein LOC115331401 [Ixodes scapularis]